MAYDIKYRKQVIEYRSKGHTLAQTNETFSISETTIKKWITMHKSGTLSDPPRKKYFRKINPTELKKFVEENPDSYQHEMAEHFGCRQQSIAYQLAKLRITRKKRQPNTKNKTLSK